MTKVIETIGARWEAVRAQMAPDTPPQVLESARIVFFGGAASMLDIMDGLEAMENEDLSHAILEMIIREVRGTIPTAYTANTNEQGTQCH